MKRFLSNVKKEWGYSIPESAEEQAQLKAICRQFNQLENYFLEITREYLLGRLTAAKPSLTPQLWEIVQSLRYPDAEFKAAVETARKS